MELLLSFIKVGSMYVWVMQDRISIPAGPESETYALPLAGIGNAELCCKAQEAGRLTCFTNSDNPASAGFVFFHTWLRLA